MSNPQPPDLPEQPQTVDKDVVWMNCRAKKGCEGHYAKAVFKKTIPLVDGGGESVRYRCMTCNGVWHIRR